MQTNQCKRHLTIMVTMSFHFILFYFFTLSSIRYFPFRRSIVDPWANIAMQHIYQTLVEIDRDCIIFTLKFRVNFNQSWNMSFQRASKLNLYERLSEKRVSRSEKVRTRSFPNSFVSWRFICFLFSLSLLLCSLSFFLFFLLLFIVLIPVISHATYQSRTTLLRPSKRIVILVLNKIYRNDTQN